jgi:hypothetical protein
MILVSDIKVLPKDCAQTIRLIELMLDSGFLLLQRTGHILEQDLSLRLSNVLYSLAKLSL